MKYIWILAFLGVCSCTQTVINDDGTKTIRGFVSMTVEPSANPETFAGHITEVKQIGVHLYKTPSQSGVGIGYSRLKEGFIYNNVLVLGDPTTIN